MANVVKSAKTSLGGSEVISRSVQFFSSEKWRCQSQSENIATFEGKQPIPWFLMLLTIAAFFFFIIPGIILWIFVVRKVNKFQNIVITTKSISEGSEVDVKYPQPASKLVNRFIDSLPPYELDEAPSGTVEQPVEA